MGVPQAKLVAADGAAFDRFGGAVAVDLQRAIVGALDAEENGAAYIFERSAVVDHIIQEISVI